MNERCHKRDLQFLDELCKILMQVTINSTGLRRNFSLTRITQLQLGVCVVRMVGTLYD